MSGAILVGIDSSTPSRSAIEWSVNRAAATGVGVELLHVIDPAGHDLESPEWQTQREHAEQLMAAELAWATSLDASIPLTTSFAEGRPSTVLAEKSAGHSLLVVGTHKTGFIYGRSFGSAFLGLGSTAHCDVAFIPNLIGGHRHGIVTAAYGAPVDATVIRLAGVEAMRANEALTLVGCGAPPRYPDHERAAAARAETLRQCVRLVEDSQPKIRVRSRIVEADMAEALVTASINAALLVIGQPRKDKALSAVNHDVLVNMSGPVMVVLEGES